MFVFSYFLGSYRRGDFYFEVSPARMFPRGQIGSVGNIQIVKDRRLGTQEPHTRDGTPPLGDTWRFVGQILAVKWFFCYWSHGDARRHGLGRGMS